jgi:large subunit ribosomal protein L21
MYAIVQFGSSQYKVSEGDVIEIDRLADEKSENVKADQVLLIADGKDVKVGQPSLKGATVEAKVLDQTMGEKVFAFKYRCRKGFTWKRGHRAKLTALKITKISA